MQFYRIDYDRLLSFSIKRFWFLHRQIDRINAEIDLRQVQVAAGVASQDGYAKVVERLEKQVGKIVVFAPSVTTMDLDDDKPDPGFDRNAFNALKAKVRASKH